MQYPEVVAVVNSLIPDIARTADPQGVLLKYAKENSLTPAVLERMGQAFNQGTALQTMMGSDRGADAVLVDVEKLTQKYAEWKAPVDFEKEAAAPKTHRVPNLVSSMLREKRAGDDMHTLILELAGDNARLQLAHWRADTKTNEHEALGNLYEAIAGLVDRLAEVSMGADDNRNFASVDVTLDPDTEPKDLLDSMKSTGDKLVAKAKADGSEDLQNIAADVVENINRTLYKLQSPTKSAADFTKSEEAWEMLLEESRELLEKAAAELSKRLFADGDVESDSRQHVILSDAAEADAIRAHGPMAKQAFDWYQVWAGKRWGACVKRAEDALVQQYKLANDWSGKLGEASLMVLCYEALVKSAEESVKIAARDRYSVEVDPETSYKEDKRYRQTAPDDSSTRRGATHQQTTTGEATPSAGGGRQTPTASGKPVKPPVDYYTGDHLSPSIWRPKEKETEYKDVEITPAVKSILGMLSAPADRLDSQMTRWLDTPRKNKALQRVDDATQSVVHQHNLQKLLLTDPVISKADPAEVGSIFESIRRGSDDVASDINLLRFQLREALQYGGVPPDSYKQLQSIGELRDIHEKATRESDRERYGGKTTTTVTDKGRSR